MRRMLKCRRLVQVLNFLSVPELIRIPARSLKSMLVIEVLKLNNLNDLCARDDARAWAGTEQVPS
jgi:hypothetical protein